MTPERFGLAVALFHLTILIATVHMASRWAPASCARSWPRWLASLGGAALSLGVLAYLCALLVSVGANIGLLPQLRLGSLSGRLMGQALFAEGSLLALLLALRHRAAGRADRGALLAGAAGALVAVFVDAHVVEPQMLKVRRHVVDRASGAAEGPGLRILHLTDIQTPAIGAHEERALRTGMGYRPDLIVFTGDYVQNALGRPTERTAARDLRALIARLDFDAPLGVFATEGDCGPPCREVFGGTRVRCVVDETVTVPLGGGRTLAVTGLSRFRGRERDPRWLARLMSEGPRGDHRIVISHAPDFVDALPAPVDLVLAGHTHGGQVVIPFFGPPVTAIRLPRRFAGGLNVFAGTPLHVSRGVGMERGFAPPVRFFCPPEICVLDVRLPGGNASAVARSGSRPGTGASASS